MNPNLLKYILRKNYVSLKQGKMSKTKYQGFIKKSYTYLKQPTFKSKVRTTKKELLYFKRLSK